jgi:hypothetical protein
MIISYLRAPGCPRLVVTERNVKQPLDGKPEHPKPQWMYRPSLLLSPFCEAFFLAASSPDCRGVH